MKRMLLLNFIFISCFLFGQTNNVVTTILEGDGYTYVRKLSPSDMVHLYNQANQLTHVNLVYKDTGKRPPLHLREKRVEDEAWSYEKAREIVNNAFSLDQKLSVSDRLMMVSIYISSTTGRIMEVEFEFRGKGPFAQIPLSVFREIEVRLKEEVWFTLTEAGRKVNYVFFAWNHEVK